jgi:hypothetical protein
LVIASLASSLALLGCGKQPEQVADKQASDGVKSEAGQPTGEADPEQPVIEGELPEQPKPAEPQAVDEPPTPPPSEPQDDDEDVQDEGVEAHEDHDDPPEYPEQVGADPGPFVHPPAEAVLVIASTRSYSPGETAVDRDAKYRTWIWRPSAGALPAKGKATATVEGGPALVEEADGLIVSDGSKLVQLSFDESTVELVKCECDEMDQGQWRHTKKKLAKKLFGMSSQPLGPWAPGVLPTPSGEAKVLVGATEFERKSKMDCITAREDVEHVLQAAAVAGSRVFVVERVVDNAACNEDAAAPYELRTQRLIDVGGAKLEHAAFERELPYKVVKRARTEAAEQLDQVAQVSDYDLAPINLKLTAVFPKYREHKGGVRLLLQYSVKTLLETLGAGGWGNGWDSHVITIAYPESSSLTAPASAMQLIEYVHREGGGKWKVIGWSQINADNAASPGAPPLPG